MISSSSATAAPLAERQFVITRTLDAPRDLVWRAWSDPKHVAKWFGPRIFSNPDCDFTPKVGSTFRIVMQGPAGDRYPFTGEFLEVVPQERIVYTNDGSEHGEQWLDMVYPDRDRNGVLPKPITEVTFEDAGKKTKMTITMTFEKKADLDGHIRVGMYYGWADSLDAFAELVKEDQGAVFVQVTRRYSLPAEQVYDAWLEKDAVGTWLFRTPTGTLQKVEMDARVGGGFTVVERRGDVEAAHVGKFIVLDRPHQIVFDFSVFKNFENPARVEISISPVDGGCELELKQGLPTAFAEYADRSRDGWAGILAGLARTLGMQGGIFPGEHA